MAALPPDFDTKVFPLVDPKLILSVSDNAYELPPLITQDLALYVENFALPTTVTAPRTIAVKASDVATIPLAKGATSQSGSNDAKSSDKKKEEVSYEPHSLSISTTRVDLTKTSASATIDLSAPAAPKGEPGSKGGDISLYIEDLPTGILPFNLRVDGGAGSGSSDTTSATNGADAGSLAVMLQSQYAQPIATFDRLQNAFDSHVPTVASFVTDLENAIQGVPNLAQLTETIKDLRTALSTNDSGKALKLLRRIDTILTEQNQGGAIESRHKVSSHGGSYGVDSKGLTNGLPGKDSEPQILAVSSPDDRCSWTVPFAHPVQCRMLLEKAKLQYFIGGSKTVESSMKLLRLLNQLIDRLAFLDVLKPEHELTAAYYGSAERLFLSSGAAAINDLKAIRSEASTYLRQLQDGRDFYGNDQNYVPRGSYQDYAADNSEDVMWSNLKNLEAVYTAYLQAQAKAQEKVDAIKKAASSATQTIASNKSRIEILKIELEKDRIKIQSYDDPIKNQYAVVTKDAANIEDQIQKAWQCPLSSILGALGQCLFAPGNAMILLQGVTLANTANTQIASDDDDSRKINKAYLIKKVHKVLGDDSKARHSSLMEGHKLLPDGTIGVDDEGAEVLMGAEKDMLALIQDYTDTIGKTNVEDLKTAFDQYVAIVQERNSTIAHYNACVQVWAKYEEQNRQADAMAAQVSKDWLNKSNVDYPAVTSFMEATYLSALADIMFELYQTQRAYRFVSLSATDVIANTLGSDPQSRLNYTTLNNARSSLLRAYKHAHEAQAAPQQPFPGLKYMLTKSDTYLLGLDERSAFTIPPCTPRMGANDHPFHGKGNVRLTKARFFAPGIKTTNNKLFVRLQHGGKETIVRSDDGLAIDFQHSQIPIEFLYDLTTGAYDGDGLVDGDIGVAVAADYALVGPFTNWQIDITEADNPGLDKSAVKAPYFEFDGQFSQF